jgi:cyclopropane fatty-acyl-phospholipid synthase-like methyltransferase
VLKKIYSPPPAIRSAYHAIYRTLLPVQWWLSDHLGQKNGINGLQLPPAKLRFRVAENIDVSLFYRVGAEASGNIQAVLEQLGHTVSEFRNILDFGCGCGRILMWLMECFPDVHWFGTDVDAEAIEWCRQKLPNAKFNVNGPLPPAPYPNESFDLIYGISVFTHLNDSYQRAWIPELHRMLRPGGLLLMTFFGEHVWKDMDATGEVERRGIIFRTSEKLKGVQPDWYQTTLQSSSHILQAFSTHFARVKVSLGAFGDHDVLIAERD